MMPVMVPVMVTDTVPFHVDFHGDYHSDCHGACHGACDVDCHRDYNIILCTLYSASDAGFKVTQNNINKMWRRLPVGAKYSSSIFNL